MTLRAFIDKWTQSGGAERSSSQHFLLELCDALGVAKPPAVNDSQASQDYRFERHLKVTSAEGTQDNGFVDLYKAGHFVLESKQGSEAGSAKKGTAARGTPGWHAAMEKAFGQAVGYAKSVEVKPTFLIVVDVGLCFDLYASFDDGAYQRFLPPQKEVGAARSNRVSLRDLESHADTFRKIWNDPKSLNPRLYQEKVTREVADKLAKLTRKLEMDGHGKQEVSEFLMRCLFAMFSEDVGLLPKGVFTRYLEEFWLKNPRGFAGGVEQFFRTMDTGGVLLTGEEIRRFNGGLYNDARGLPLSAESLKLLHEAALSEWSEVEPSIFGTLVERALDPAERHKLGAHFTPRAYVERLVRPTVEEPLREEWELVKATARALTANVDDLSKPVAKKKTAEALGAIRAFHKHLCEIVVLDPACGTGNFLYVTLDMMKRLESEVLAELTYHGDAQTGLELQGLRVSPAQFKGIDINPRAKPIAELVLWLGYLQWQIRQSGVAGVVDDPVLRDFGNIECRDALLTWDGDPVMRLGADGKPVTRWDGKTTKKHPVTGKDVPDDTARIPIWDYPNARAAEWPRADYIVGNPPFLGNKRLREGLGDGYFDALRAVWGDVPASADLVMYWWHRSATLVGAQKTLVAGLITTNSVAQSFNRSTIALALGHSSLVYVVPDHPWVDSVDGAAVRVAMTVLRHGSLEGQRLSISDETTLPNGAVDVVFGASQFGALQADLSVGAASSVLGDLSANEGLSFMGVLPVGSGFLLTDGHPICVKEPAAVKRYMNGRDLAQSPRNVMLIDFWGLSADEARDRFPHAYQHVLENVLPERLSNRFEPFRTQWWLHGWARPILREAVLPLARYVAICRTGRHFVFQFLEGKTLPDSKLVAIATKDALHLGVLSSRAHIVWALAVGSELEDRPTYNNSICFDKFPFPDPPEPLKQRIRDLGERLDAHRKVRQAEHPGLTITGMYNVLESLRAGRPLTAKEKPIHEQGLVSVLKQIHDKLDTAVFEAYGWPSTLTDAEILQRVVDLNHERAEEEKRGLIRWLRPDFQKPKWEARQAKLAGKAGKKKVQSAHVASVVEAEAVEPEVVEAADSETEAASPKRKGRPAGAKNKPKAVAGESAEAAAPVAAAGKAAWPKGMKERVIAVRDAMADGAVRNARQVCALFTGAAVEDVTEVLESMAATGGLLEGSLGGVAIWQKPVRPSLRPSAVPLGGGGT